MPTKSTNRPGRLALLSLLFTGCGPGDADSTGPDTDATEPLACEPVDISLVDTWREDVLVTDLEANQRGTTGVALGDVDGDGWLDAVFAGAAGTLLFLNDGTGRLALDQALVDPDGLPLTGAHAVSLADLDGDGDLDGVLGRQGLPDGVLRGDGAGHLAFEPLSIENEGITLTVQLGDADGDGDLDVYAATGIADVDAEQVLSGDVPGVPDRLYLNDGAGRFSSAPLPERDVHGHTFEGRWFDADGDGDLDVYEANDGGPYIDPNHLLLNDGSGTFTLATDCGCELAMYSMGAAVGDGDNDGRPDLYVSDVGGPNYLANLGSGRFVDTTLTNGSAIPPEPTSMTGWGTSFVDLDGDRCQDLVMMLGQAGKNSEAVTALEDDWVDGDDQPDVILQGDCDGGFSRVDAWGFGDPDRSRSVAVGDLDRDGRPDLVTTGKYFLKTWQTRGGCGPGVVLSLDAGPGNAGGLGAHVVVDDRGRTTHQWMLPGTVSSSSAEELILGLGGVASLDRVTVTWLEGGTTVLEHVGAGAVHLER